MKFQRQFCSSQWRCLRFCRSVSPARLLTSKNLNAAPCPSRSMTDLERKGMKAVRRHSRPVQCYCSTSSNERTKGYFAKTVLDVLYCVNRVDIPLEMEQLAEGASQTGAAHSFLVGHPPYPRCIFSTITILIRYRVHCIRHVRAQFTYLRFHLHFQDSHQNVRTAKGRANRRCLPDRRVISRRPAVEE